MRVAEAALAKAVTIPSAAIHAHVARVRSRNPYASPEQLVRILEKEYLAVISTAGGAVGAAAAAPAVGTGVAMALTASDVATFFGASAAFTLAVASVHGIEVEDVPRRQALLMTTILGESGTKAVVDETGLRSISTARALLTRLPLATVRRVNVTLTRRLVRQQAAKQTGLALGRLVPFGIGMVVGIGGARALGRQVIRGARAAFGPAPAAFPATIELTATPGAPVLPGQPQPGPQLPGPRNAPR